MHKLGIRLVLYIFSLFLSLTAACPAWGAGPEADTPQSEEEKTKAAITRNTDFRRRLEAIVTEKKAEEELPQGLDSFFRYMPTRGAKGVEGSVGVMEAESEYTYGAKMFGKLPVEFSLLTQYIGLENTTKVELPAQLTSLQGGVEFTLPFFKVENTYFRIGAYPSFFGDDWNFDSSEFRVPSRYFLICQPSDKLTFIAGAAVYPEFRSKVLPILGFIYKPNDRLAFNIIPKRPNITYQINDKLTVFAEGEGSYEEFEVTKDNLNDAALIYKEMHLGTGVTYKFNKFVQASVSAGSIFDRTIKYKDSLGKVNIKNGAYMEFRVEIDM